MSTAAEVEKLGDAEFKWGRKRGVGVKNKGVQFYESFCYDDVEYTLHDCVYMHNEGEAQPYIGKLVKIWQNPDKSKKVKVQWFFRPSEISFWLQHHNLDALENEIFFASGEGVGLANINPVEAIAGRCNVVCISIDSRNPQPSEVQLEMADYVFYRTFDVGSCTISNIMDDKVGGVEVNFVFNRKDSEMATGPRLVSGQTEAGGKIAVEKNHTGSIVNAITNKVKDSRLLVKNEQGVKSEDPNGMGARPSKRAKLDNSLKLTKGKDVMKDDKSTGAENAVKTSVLSVAEEKTKSVHKEFIGKAKDKRFAEDSSTLDEKPSKKAKRDSSLKLSKGKDVMKDEKSTGAENEVKTSELSIAEEKTKSVRKELVGMAKDKRFAEDSSTLDERPSKKSKVQQSENPLVLNKLTKNATSMNKIAPKEMLEEKDKVGKNSIRLGNGSPSVTCEGKIAKSITLGEGLSKEKPNERTCKLTNNSLMMNKGKGISEENLDKKVCKLASNNLANISEASVDVDEKIEGKIFEVTRRPDVEKGKWFRSLPWEERIQSAHEKRTLVLLQNLHPDYTSREVEDIVWSAFKENCDAKVVQRTAFSSPHSGQAFVIFKTREAAERVIRKLNDGCLILPNQRPLVGCMAVLPKFTGKQSTFVGHLFIDKIKLQMQKEMKDALSTSHCSQPNTIEYELAMEWCWLQSRFHFSWEALYKQQGKDLKRLMASFKSN